MIKWTDITAFYNVRKLLASYPELANGNMKVAYKAKIKIDGTNSAIQCHEDSSVIAQSRERLITPENDNVGFARWVETNQSAWRLKNNLIVFGEYCGRGIGKNVAINNIGKKVFAVFGARSLTDPSVFISEPHELREIVKGIPDTYVLPWYNKVPVVIDWSTESEALAACKEISMVNEWVSLVEDNDPWVEAEFGVKGIGEGIVFYPVSKEHLGADNFSNLCFKAKGEKHRVVKTKAAVSVAPEVMANVEQFVNSFCTDARLEQGISKVSPDGTINMQMIGKFIGWVSGDVEKESGAELEANGFVWKQMQKPVSDRARKWFLEKIKVS